MFGSNHVCLLQQPETNNTRQLLAVGLGVLSHDIHHPYFCTCWNKCCKRGIAAILKIRFVRLFGCCLDVINRSNLRLANLSSARTCFYLFIDSFSFERAPLHQSRLLSRLVLRQGALPVVTLCCCREGGAKMNVVQKATTTTASPYSGVKNTNQRTNERTSK